MQIWESVGRKNSLKTDKGAIAGNIQLLLSLLLHVPPYRLWIDDQRVSVKRMPPFRARVWSCSPHILSEYVLKYQVVTEKLVDLG